MEIYAWIFSAFAAHGVEAAAGAADAGDEQGDEDGRGHANHGPDEPGRELAVEGEAAAEVVADLDEGALVVVDADVALGQLIVDGVLDVLQIPLLKGV